VEKIMRKLILVIIGGGFILSFAAFAIGYQAGCDGDEAVFGGSKVVREDEPINGNLAIFGGTVLIEKNAVVNGDVAIFGGYLTLDGHITGDVVNFGGTIERGKTSKVSGKVALVGGEDKPSEQIKRDDFKEVVATEVASSDGEESEWPKVANRGLESISPSFANRIFNLLGEIIGTILETIAFGVVGLLLTIFLPNHVRRVGEAAENAPAASAAIGFMSLLAMAAGIVLAAITIIGIPIALLIPFLTVAAAIFGWIGLGFFFGNRLLRAVDIRSPRPAAAAAIGAGGLALFSNLTTLIPVVSWVVMPLLWVWGLGATVLTRGGTRSYPRRLAKINDPIPPSTFDPLDELDPKAGPNWSSDDLFADLAFDLGIEDELYGDDDEDLRKKR
jgi:hypothetical protein